jgi:hypothetical protein
MNLPIAYLWVERQWRDCKIRSVKGKAPASD